MLSIRRFPSPILHRKTTTHREKQTIRVEIHTIHPILVLKLFGQVFNAYFVHPFPFIFLRAKGVMNFNRFKLSLF